MKTLLKFAFSVVSVFTAAYFIPGVAVDSVETAAVVAIVLGLLNTFVKPVFAFLTLPITVLTLGVFYFILNGIIVLLTATFVPGFAVDSLLSAVLFSLLVSIVNSILNALLD